MYRYHLLTVVVILFILRMLYQFHSDKYTAWDILDTTRNAVFALLIVFLYGIVEIFYAG